MSEKIFLSKTEYLKNHREKSELFGLLPEWRWVKYQKIKNEQAECESLLAGMLLVKGLCRYAGIGGMRHVICLIQKIISFRKES